LVGHELTCTTISRLDLLCRRDPKAIHASRQEQCRAKQDWITTGNRNL
jgi:hypothetical protein